MRWPKNIIIKEVGPRDGLQNEKRIISTLNKIQWINQLSNTGLSYIEVTSFVHPKWIPSLADSFEVASGIKKKTGVSYAALVPNEKGLEKALEANLDEISIFMSASEEHNQKNINKSISETIPVLNAVSKEALKHNKKVRAYLSTVFGCPYEGKVDQYHVLNLVEKMLEMGVYEVSLGDTIGVANPLTVEDVLSSLLKEFPANVFALHFHNTYGTALANIVVAMDMGMTIFDASIGGLGGCPYAPGASGNVATDDLNYLITSMGIQTGISQEKLLKTAHFLQQKLKKKLPSNNMLVYGNSSM